MTQEQLRELIELVRELAAEQATREFSGINWYNEFSERLNSLIKKIDFSEQLKNE